MKLSPIILSLFCAVFIGLALIFPTDGVGGMMWKAYILLGLYLTGLIASLSDAVKTTQNLIRKLPPQKLRLALTIFLFLAYLYPMVDMAYQHCSEERVKIKYDYEISCPREMNITHPMLEMHDKVSVGSKHVKLEQIGNKLLIRGSEMAFSSRIAFDFYPSGPSETNYAFLIEFPKNPTFGKFSIWHGHTDGINQEHIMKFVYKGLTPTPNEFNIESVGVRYRIKSIEKE